MLSHSSRAAIEMRDTAAVLLRLALAAAFLSAVADRFGLWGPPDADGVAWGNFASFLAYTSAVTPFFPETWVATTAWVTTGAELVVSVLLIVGLWTSAAAMASGVLLLLFAIGMTAGTGIKPVLDASVLSASAGAFVLSTLPSYRWSVDAYLRKRRRP